MTATLAILFICSLNMLWNSDAFASQTLPLHGTSSCKAARSPLFINYDLVRTYKYCGTIQKRRNNQSDCPCSPLSSMCPNNSKEDVVTLPQPAHQKPTIDRHVNKNGMMPISISMTLRQETKRRQAAISVKSGAAQPNNLRSPPNWRDKLLKVSNVASFLCVIDCTLLPIVTIVLPLLGLGASPATTRWLHELGHSMALLFVLPVGGFAALMNFMTHRNTFLSSIGALGLFFIYLANGGHNFPIISLLPHDLAHSLHCGGLLHKSVNISGCIMLLGSNSALHQLNCHNPNHQHGVGSSIAGLFNGLLGVGGIGNLCNCETAFGSGGRELMQADVREEFFVWNGDKKDVSTTSRVNRYR